MASLGVYVVWSVLITTPEVGGFVLGMLPQPGRSRINPIRLMKYRSIWSSWHVACL
jgi:hypothetical protein